MRKCFLITSLLMITACAAGVGKYDGDYSGSMTPAAGNDPNCAGFSTVQMRVSNNILAYQHYYNAVVYSNVAADGSFSSASQKVTPIGTNAPVDLTLIGKVSTDGTILARASVGTACAYALSLKRA